MRGRKPAIVLLLGTLYALPFVFTWVQARHIQGIAIARSNDYQINVMAYGAKGDGKTDDGPAFMKAFTDAAELGLPVIIPKRTFLVNRPLNITSGMLIRSDDATIKHTGGDTSILVADTVDDWVIQGPLTLIGTRTAEGQSSAEAGLFIRSCNRFIVDKLTLRNFRGAGLEILAGDTSGQMKGDQGQFAFVSFIENTVGMKIHDGTASEYNLFTLLSFSGNDTATEIAAGNNVISTSNIVDNANGIFLRGSINSGHGIIASTNVNHNHGFNIKVENVPQGYSFEGCHIYANTTSSGFINLIDSQGIHFNGGNISAPIVNDGGALNLAFNSFTPGANYSVTGTDAADFRSAFIFDASTIYDSFPPHGSLTDASCHRSPPSKNRH